MGRSLAVCTENTVRHRHLGCRAGLEPDGDLGRAFVANDRAVNERTSIVATIHVNRRRAIIVIVASVSDIGCDKATRGITARTDTKPRGIVRPSCAARIVVVGRSYIYRVDMLLQKD